MKYDDFKQFSYLQIMTTKEESKEIIKWVSKNELKAHITLAALHAASDRVGMILYFNEDDHAAVFKSVWQPELNQ